MKKRTSANPDNGNPNVWGEPTQTQENSPVAPSFDDETTPVGGELFAPVADPTDEPVYDLDLGYDIEGLKTDFPTAGELIKFVFDETNISLNLKGRSNELKYQIALDVLNGKQPPAQYVTGNNPYLDKADLVPEEPLKPTPTRDPRLANAGAVQNSFYSGYVPHPDADMRAMDKKVDVIFRKYVDGTISYEVLGPLQQKPEGNKIDRYGRPRPEIIRWVDPRTGEQVAQLPDGTQTPVGRKIRAMMRSLPFNKTNHWDKWVDREFVASHQEVIANPWQS